MQRGRRQSGERNIYFVHKMYRYQSEVESEIEYRPPSIIGRVYKICALLGQLLLAYIWLITVSVSIYGGSEI